MFGRARAPLLALLVLAPLVRAALAGGTPAADRGALWRIVTARCVPAFGEGATLPPPCLAVDPARGVAVIKDRVGVAQVLVIPTDRITGIEDPALLSPGRPDLWPAAWGARRLVEARLGRALPRDLVGLALNSAMGRSQDQLHIHVDCLRGAVRDQLRRAAPMIGAAFTAPVVVAGGHSYRVRRLAGGGLAGQDPVRLVADGGAGARAAMARQTIAVVGAVFAGGRPGFWLLEDQADAAAGDFGHAEDLLDHACAAVPPIR